MALKRIGILTSGGDAPGMNAAIRSIVRYALYNRLEATGIMRGFQGLIDGELLPLGHRSVSNIINRGGTILKTARSQEFLTEQGQKRAAGVIRDNQIDALIVLGGNGTYQGAHLLNTKYNIPCVGVPATIDNDLNGTEATIGSDTAVNTALSAIDKIRDTATSLERIFVVEVMGRESGFIAIQVALGGGAEEVIIPERNFDIDSMCSDIVEGNLKGKVSWIIIVAEGACRAEDIARQIGERTELEVRVVVLGHIQRGGTPTAQDRILALRLGAAAVDLLLKGESDKAVGWVSEKINTVDLAFAFQKKRMHTDSVYRLIRILT